MEMFSSSSSCLTLIPLGGLAMKKAVTGNYIAEKGCLLCSEIGD
jgi:hypothetical protein